MKSRLILVLTGAACFMAGKLDRDPVAAPEPAAVPAVEQAEAPQPSPVKQYLFTVGRRIYDRPYDK